MNKKMYNLYQYLLSENADFLSESQKEKLPVFRLLRVLFVIGCLIVPLALGIYLYLILSKESFILGVGILILLYKFLPSIYKNICKKINFDKYKKTDSSKPEDSDKTSS